MPVGRVVTVEDDGGAEGTAVVGGAVVQIPVATVVVIVVDADGVAVVVTGPVVCPTGDVASVGGSGTLRVVVALPVEIVLMLAGKVTVSVVAVLSEGITVVVSIATC